MTIHDATQRIKEKKRRQAGNINSVDDLRDADADYNPRHADYDAIQRLNKTLNEFGDLGCIVFNVRTGNLVGGHQRKKTFDPSWKIEKNPVSDSVGTVAEGNIVTPYGNMKYREVDWDQQREMAANLAANSPAGNWVFEKRNDILDIINTGSFDMELTGHSLDSIEKLLTWAPKPGESHIPGVDAGLSEENTREQYTPKEKHHKIQQFEQNPNSVSPEEITTVKINLEFNDVQWLDQFFKDMGFSSRSEAVRYLIKLYRGEYTQDGVVLDGPQTA